MVAELGSGGGGTWLESPLNIVMRAVHDVWAHQDIHWRRRQQVWALLALRSITQPFRKARNLCSVVR